MKIGFLESELPKFQEGTYKFISEQEVTIKENNIDILNEKQTYEKVIEWTQEISYLEDNMIHSVYPPAFSTGAFGNVLPQITFMSPTLPWEKEIGKEKGIDGIDRRIPWMSLLLFRDDENVEIQNVKIDNKDIQVLKVPVPLGNNTNDGGTIPTNQEMLYLAHVKCVKVNDKESDLFKTDGHFASVLGNRIPGSEEKEEHTYFAYLVSRIPVKMEQKDRDFEYFHVLYQWNYKVLSDLSEHFICAMNKILDSNTCYMGKLDIESTPAGANILQNGYRPFKYQVDEGKTVAWYRSPCINPTFNQDEQKGSQPQKQTYKCIRQESEAIASIVDGNMLELTDITYAAAFSLGRTLAMQNPAFLEALYELRKRHHEEEQGERDINILKDFIYENTMGPYEKKESTPEIYSKQQAIEEILHQCSNCITEEDILGGETK